MNAAVANPGHSGADPAHGERFLAAVVGHALDDGWRSPSDFLRHFGPRTLMRSLASDPALRARVLVATTHVNERLAARKTEASAAEDLALALDEGLTDPEKLLSLIPPEARVRHLDASKLWTFVTETEFWKADQQDREARDRMVQRVTFILESALRAGVLRLQDIADGIGFKRIAQCLPQSELQRVVEHALSRAREGHRLTEEQLLEAVPLHSLMRHVPLEHTWNEVVLGRLARPLGLVPARPGEPPTRRTVPPPPPSRKVAVSAPGFDAGALPESLLELQRGLQRSQTVEDALEDLTAVTVDDTEETQIHLDVEERADAEMDTRVDVKAIQDEEERHHAETASELERVRGALETVGRLPTKDLSLPILLSIESMYEELRQSEDPARREAIVREAFPNETHLRIALSALIRLLDPDGRTSDSALGQADAESLVSALVYEEQRLKESGAPGSSSAPSR